MPLIFPDVEASFRSCSLCALIFSLAQNSSLPKPLEVAALIPPSRQSHDFLYELDRGGLSGASFGEPQPQWYGLKRNDRRINTMEPVSERSGSRFKTTGYRIISPWQVSIAADKGTNASKYVTRRPVSKQGSEKSFETLLSTIQNCDLNHSRCHLGVDGKQTAEIPLLPTRVIDVGSAHPPRVPRLIISNGQRGKYASLSHCWGSQRWVATTSSTIHKMQDGFELDDIPRTYADAITVTRKLGLQYLWIDSFCIIQDDRDDWRAESQQMGNIYEQAYCNIAATGAEDGRTGFLNTRKSDHIFVRVPSSEAEQGEDYVYFSNQPDSDFDKCVCQTKVNNRGWVLQERILSRRTIHFAQDQWYWECGENIISEDGWLHETRGSSNGTTISLRKSLEDSTMPIGKIFTDETDKEHAFSDSPATHRTSTTEVLWAQILRSYSNCQLTFASDKIPALQGLANKFEGVVLSRYLFGHWIKVKRSLPLSLMWFAAKGGGIDFPPQKRAPSWSCLKGDGPIGFHDCRGASPCTLIDELIKKTDSDLPDHTSIVMRGKLRQAKKAFPNGSSIEERDTFFSISFTSQTPYGNFTNTLGPAKFDNANDIPAEIMLLLTFEVKPAQLYSNAQKDQIALVLKEIEDDGGARPWPVYRRIGIAYVNNHKFFEDVQFSRLQII